MKYIHTNTIPVVGFFGFEYVAGSDGFGGIRNRNFVKKNKNKKQYVTRWNYRRVLPYGCELKKKKKQRSFFSY